MRAIPGRLNTSDCMAILQAFRSSIGQNTFTQTSSKLFPRRVPLPPDNFGVDSHFPPQDHFCGSPMISTNHSMVEHAHTNSRKTSAAADVTERSSPTSLDALLSLLGSNHQNQHFRFPCEHKHHHTTTSLAAGQPMVSTETQCSLSL